VAEKQLNIILRARDEATKVLEKVGDAVKHTGAKIKEMDSVAETGHGFHKQLRVARNMAMAFEILPVGVDAAKAALAALSGTASESAAAQQTLLDSIKQFPVVGKLAGEAAEWFGNGIAHIFGKETTAEVQAGLAARELALKNFASALPKILADTHKATSEAALIGLLPSDGDIEKAKLKYKDAHEAIFEQKQTISTAQTPLQDQIDEATEKAKTLRDNANRQKKWDGIGFDSFRDADKAATVAEHALQAMIGQRNQAATANANLDAQDVANAKIRDAEIAAANRKRLQEDKDFHNSLRDQNANAAKQLAALDSDYNSKVLEGDNNAYAARILMLKDGLARQVAEIAEAGQKQIEEIEKQESEQQAMADAGNKKALVRLQELQDQKDAIAGHVAGATESATAASAQEQANARSQTIRDAIIAGLSAEAAAGDVNAGIDKERLTIGREREATEKALLAIAGDASYENRQAAQDATQTLAAMRSGYEKILSLNLAASELDILKQRAALGDIDAGIKSHNLELSFQLNEAEAKLNDAKERGNAIQKAEAEKQIAQLRAIPKLEADNTIRDSALFVLQQESSLGDKNAERELKRIEIQKQFNAERMKALAILQAEGSTEKQKADAKKSISSMDAVEKAALSRIGAEKQNGLASLVEGQYLTGVQASAAQEKDPYQPIVDAQNKNNEIAKSMVDLLAQYLPFLKPNISRPPKKLT
jgi:hypothetical protein